MKPGELKIYADFMKKYGLDYIEVRKGDFHLILSKKGQELQELKEKVIENINQEEVIKKSREKTQKLENIVYVKSPLVGTFYCAPSPESPPFVEVGSKIKKGDVLCIVEAMKVMNEIKSEVEGTIKEILVENATPVEFGQVLFVIET